MTYQFDQVHIDNGQLVISGDEIIPKTLGEGEEKIKHSQKKREKKDTPGKKLRMGIANLRRSPSRLIFRCVFASL